MKIFDSIWKSKLFRYSSIALGSIALVAALSNLDLSVVGPRNMLTNPGAEAGLAGVVFSGGAPKTYTNTFANVGTGSSAFDWQSTAAGQTMTLAGGAIPAGMYGHNGEASCNFQCSSGTCTHTIQAFDGTNVIGQTITIVSAANYQRTAATFIFPSSGNLSLRITSVAADEPQVFIDDCWLGENKNVGLGSMGTAWTNTNTFGTSTWGTVTASNIYSRRVLDSMEVRGSFKSGTLVASSAVIGMPTGLVIDSTKFGSTTSTQFVGTIRRLESSSAQIYSGGAAGDLFYDGSDTGNIYVAQSGASNAYTKINASTWAANGEVLAFNFTVPIVGWTATQLAVQLNQLSNPTVQKFISGSGTYTTPPGVTWIKVTAMGGGGGGSSGGVGSGNGSVGGSTTFGSTLVVANGGPGGIYNSTNCVGGTASLGTGVIGIAVPGGSGAAGLAGVIGGIGGSSALGGAGSGGFVTVGSAGATNTGGGGGGGGPGAGQAGAGGCSGGYAEAIINNPASSYAYAVGAAGSAGTGGTSGGAGGSGILSVEEHYSYDVPIVVGGVSTSSITQAFRMESVSFGASGGTLSIPTPCSSSPCTMYSNTPGITGVTRNGTGSYVVAFAAGTFSVIPICMGIDTSGSDRILASDGSTARSTTSVQYLLKAASSGTNTDSSVEILCMGPH